MGKKIGIGIAALVVVLLGVISMQPSTYRVERSAAFDAPAAVVFDYAQDLKKFDEWSPWNEFDLEMKKTYGDKTAGVGATYEWSGNSEVGSGRMTVTEAKSPTTVRIGLEFLAPMANTAKGGFDIAAVGDDKSKATWWVEGNNDFMGKAASLFMDFDKMIGDTYAKGLDKLGEVAKKEAVAQAKAKADAEAEAKAQAEAKAKAEAAALANAGDPAAEPAK